MKKVEKVKERIRESIKKPFVPGIESTNFCGGHCKGCPYDQMTRKRGNIDEYTFKLAVENILKFSIARSISLHHFGDPLLHPELVKLINYAESKGFRTRISTIGNALTPKLIDELVNSQLSMIKFSFFGTNKKDFENFQKPPFNKTIENIDSFIKKNKKTKVVIEILNDGSQDITQHPHFKEWKSMLHEKRMSNFIGDDEKVDTYTKIKRKTINEPCPRLWKGNLKILWNGDVVPCCFDYDGKAVIGNIEEKNLKKIWEGEKMNEMRRLHKEGKRNEVELCKYCQYEEYDSLKKLFFISALGNLPEGMITLLPRIDWV